MRMSTLSIVIAVVLTGTQQTQAQAPKPEPIPVAIKETIRLKTNLKLLDESGLATGTKFGDDLKDISGCYVIKDETRVPLSVSSFLKDTKLDKCVYFPEGVVLVAGTEIAAGSCIVIDKNEKLPRPLVNYGLTKIEEGDYKKLDKEDFAQDAIMQKEKAKKDATIAYNANAKADAALAAVKKLEVDVEDLMSFKKRATKVINDLSERVADSDEKVAQAQKTANEAKDLAGAVDRNLSAAMKDFAAAQKALAETQKVAPPATLPPAPTTQLYAFPAGTPAETTHGGETYVRQPCGNYKKKV